MYARVSTLRLDPSKLDEAVEHFRSNELPKIEALDGFKGFTLMVDRDSGTAVGTGYWESAEAEQASREQASAARRNVAEAGAASGEPEVAVYEVAIDTEA